MHTSKIQSRSCSYVCGGHGLRGVRVHAAGYLEYVLPRYRPGARVPDHRGSERCDDERRNLLPDHRQKSIYALRPFSQQCRLPCVYLVDSGGAVLLKHANVFADEQRRGTEDETGWDTSYACQSTPLCAKSC